MHAMRPIHYSDREVRRPRLYNASWRLLGETAPHPTTNGSTAGTYYSTSERTWHTFDQVIVSGGLLTTTPPFLDEASVRVLNARDYLSKGGRVERFQSLNGIANNGVSDHLPVYGYIQMTR
jgi:hypothetical protein